MRGEPFKIEPYTLASGEGQTLYFKGAYFRILECVGATSLHIGVDDYSAYEVPVGVGVPVPDGFDKIRVENKSGGSVSLKLAVGLGGVDDDRFTASAALDLSKASRFDDGADVALGAGAATLIAAANASRRGVMISNDTGAAIRVGGATVAAARGLNIPAGGIAVIPTAGAVYGYSAGGGNVSFSEVND
nr:hypothetical protein 12 [Moraxellaceae bacterium]